MPWGKAELGGIGETVEFCTQFTLEREEMGPNKTMTVKGSAGAVLFTIPLDIAEMRKTGNSAIQAVRDHVKEFDDFVFVIVE